MNRTSRTRVALIGVGAWGMHAHLPALAACDDVEVAALVDPRIGELRAVAAGYGIHDVFENADVMLQEVPHIDAVVLATPTDTHRAIALKTVQRGVWRHPLPGAGWHARPGR